MGSKYPTCSRTCLAQYQFGELWKFYFKCQANLNFIKKYLRWFNVLLLCHFCIRLFSLILIFVDWDSCVGTWFGSINISCETHFESEHVQNVWSAKISVKIKIYISVWATWKCLTLVSDDWDLLWIRPSSSKLHSLIKKLCLIFLKQMVFICCLLQVRHCLLIISPAQLRKSDQSF